MLDEQAVINRRRPNAGHSPERSEGYGDERCCLISQATQGGDRHVVAYSPRPDGRGVLEMTNERPKGIELMSDTIPEAK
jgi:hypothetical protein